MIVMYKAFDDINNILILTIYSTKHVILLILYILLLKFDTKLNFNHGHVIFNFQSCLNHVEVIVMCEAFDITNHY